MIRTCFCIFTSCVSFTAIKASGQTITVADVAHMTGYPAEKLSVKDETVSANEKLLRKKKPECISHHVFTSDDDTFATLSVAVGKKGTLLTPDLKKKADEIIEKTASTPGAAVRIRPLNLGKGIYGYSGLGMAGGGGSMDRSVVTLSEYDRDIQITILFGENALTPLNGAEQYQGAVITSDGVNAIIEKCLVAVSDNIVTSFDSLGTTKSSLASPQKQQITPTSSSQQTAPKNEAVIKPNGQLPKESPITWLLGLLGPAVAMLALIANSLRKRRR